MHMHSYAGHANTAGTAWHTSVIRMLLQRKRFHSTWQYLFFRNTYSTM